MSQRYIGQAYAFNTENLGGFNTRLSGGRATENVSGGRELLDPGGGVLIFELGTEVRPKVSTTIL